MGYPEALQREVHVYFNGLYFGVHHLFERIEEEWAAERFGGGDDDWEGFRIVGGNNIEVIKGTPAEVNARMLDSWQTVLTAAQAGDLATVEQYLDLDDFIDYLILNFHAGNTDWDQNNVRAMRRLNPPGKYQFFCHDSERTGLNGLSTGNLNINSITHGRGGTAHRPTNINNWLRTNPEYAIRFADRVNKHLFNDGALTPENGRAQWEARANRIRTALKAESAKWGDHADSTPRTLVDFENGLTREYNVWFPRRTPITISQMRASNLYPDIDPPVFSQHGGSDHFCNHLQRRQQWIGRVCRCLHLFARRFRCGLQYPGRRTSQRIGWKQRHGHRPRPGRRPPEFPRGCGTAEQCHHPPRPEF